MSYSKTLLIMSETIPSFLRVELKKEKPLYPLEKRLCCGIKEWDISNRRAFDCCMVMLWWKVSLTAL